MLVYAITGNVGKSLNLIIISNDSESHSGEYHAAVDLERLETFHKEETLQMTLAGKCFTATSRNFEVTAT